MKNFDPVELKQQLKQHCMNVLEQRIAVTRKAMEDAQEAANSNEKSSMGDKYETSRAMGQLDREMNARQLAEATSELDALKKLKTGTRMPVAGAGSLIQTDQGLFFIAAGIGSIDISGQRVVVVSVKSPLAKVLTGHRKNDTIHFNQKKYSIVQVH